MIECVKSGKNMEYREPQDETKVEFKAYVNEECYARCEEAGHKCGDGDPLNTWDYTIGLIYVP